MKAELHEVLVAGLQQVFPQDRTTAAPELVAQYEALVDLRSQVCAATFGAGQPVALAELPYVSGVSEVEDDPALRSWAEVGGKLLHELTVGMVRYNENGELPFPDEGELARLTARVERFVAAGAGDTAGAS